MIRLKGDYKQIGNEYGRVFADEIRKNLSVLVWREGYGALPLEDSGFVSWRKNQQLLLEDNWPWLLEEMTGVAEAVAVAFEDILLLNLRAWQYNYYGEVPGQACSSFAITLEDGTVVCAGALDDPAEFYCGPVCFKPDDGYSFITFPITGTSWGNRGMNEKGLSMGISSQLLPGLKKKENTINQDLACRVILQICATVEEVRLFCKNHSFTMNLVCVDANGGIFCAHQTSAGLFEIPAEGSAAMTNHVVNDEIKEQLTVLGVSEFSESDTTLPRLENLIDFAQQRSGKCTAQEVRKFISACDESNPGSINRHNKATVALTFSNPQNAPETFWIMQPNKDEANDKFEQLKIS